MAMPKQTYFTFLFSVVSMINTLVSVSHRTSVLMSLSSCTVLNDRNEPISCFKIPHLNDNELTK